MPRFAHWLPCAAFVLSGPLLGAPALAAATPCDDVPLPPAVEHLRDRLARTDARLAWATLAEDAARLAADQDGDGARACAHYLAGSAHFFLSAAASERLLHAGAAVGHLIAAQALAPDAMRGKQPDSRLRTAWSRLGRVDGWLTGGKPVAVEVPPAPRARHIVLSPADAAGWNAACGTTPACAEAARLPLPGGESARQILLRPGRYAVEVVGRCGTTRGEAVVARDGALPLPEVAPCQVTLVARDGDDPVADAQVWAGDRAVAAGALEANLGPVTVRAPGYLDAALTLPIAGGEVQVALSRCPVRLDVDAHPADAIVTGAGVAPWGPRTVVAQREDLGRVEQAVDVPRPASCVDASHPITIVLPRRVTVFARSADGDPAAVSRLRVQGDDVDPLGFAQPPGTYGYQAENPDLGMAVGRFTVDACPDRGPCTPTRVAVEFVSAPDRGAPTGALVTLGIGGAVAVGGLIAGATALGKQRDLEDYTTKRDVGVGIDDLIDQRDDRATTADALLATGGVVLTAGLIWWLLGGDS